MRRGAASWCWCGRGRETGRVRDGAGRRGAAAARQRAGPAARGDQLPAHQGDAPADERWSVGSPLLLQLFVTSLHIL